MAFVVALASAAVLTNRLADRVPLEPGSSFSSNTALHAGQALASPRAATRAILTDSLGRMPLCFIENRGQLDSRVAYYVQGRDTTLYFAADGMTHVQTQQKRGGNSAKGRLEKASFSRGIPRTSDPGSRWVVKLDFVGANPKPKITAGDRQPAVVSYFKGPKEKWNAGLSTYGSIVYSDLWPGIDLIYAGTANRLKYTFLVKPGADPARIRLAYRGVEGIRLNDAGQLEVGTPAGVLQDDRPYAYQEVEGHRVGVNAAYSLDPASAGGPHRYGFALGSYDRGKPLVLDPAMFVYCGYIGGSGGLRDSGNSIAVDSSGNAYITGATDSTDFPATFGPDLNFNGGLYDAFVAKINAAGTALVYCGYIGGTGEDVGLGIAVDSSGNAYVTGFTSSTQATFPLIVGPDLTYNGGTDDAFVAEINAVGTALIYCGYIGGSDLDVGQGIAVDSSGDAYVTGYTSSTQATFPVTVGPDLTHNGGLFDAFVAKISAAGTAFIYCGYIGGNGDDLGRGVAVDSSGNAYVTGNTYSTEATFPVTVGPDLTYNGDGDAFVHGIDRVHRGHVPRDRRAGPDLQWRPGRLRGEGQRRGHGTSLLRLHWRQRRGCWVRHSGGRFGKRLCHWIHRIQRGHFPRDRRAGPDLQRRLHGRLRGEDSLFPMHASHPIPLDPESETNKSDSGGSEGDLAKWVCQARM